MSHTHTYMHMHQHISFLFFIKPHSHISFLANYQSQGTYSNMHRSHTISYSNYAHVSHTHNLIYASFIHFSRKCQESLQHPHKHNVTQNNPPIKTCFSHLDTKAHTSSFRVHTSQTKQVIPYKTAKLVTTRTIAIPLSYRSHNK